MRYQSLMGKLLLGLVILLLVVPNFILETGHAATVTYGTTVLGGTGTGGYNGDGGAATGAELNGPSGIWRDMNSGVMYIADTNNHRIRKIDANGKITTVAGTGTAGFSGDGQAATSAKLNGPTDVVMDGSGNLYIADKNNHRIRKVAANGNISTVAGTGQAGYNADGIAATSAQLYEPYGVAMDSSGNLLIADSLNARIRKVDTEGQITTIAGTGEEGYSGDNGPATEAKIAQPYHLAVDTDDTLYIVDAMNQNARKVDTSGTISTLKGKNPAYPQSSPSPLTLNFPQGIAVDGQGNVYVPDSLNNVIRKLDSNGYVQDINTGTNYVYGLKADSNGTIYYVDNIKNNVFQMTILSDNAELTSVAGETDSAPGGGDGRSAGNTVTWSVYVSQSRTAIGLGDLVSATSATAKLFSDNAFSSEVTVGGTIPLTDSGATVVYVKVTAEDAITVKYYAVTVTRAPSNDAGLTSLAGKTDSAPGGGNGGTSGDAVTWSVYVPSDQSAISLPDVFPAADATIKLYTDNGFTNEVTAGGEIPLTPGGATNVYIAVTAQDTTTVKYYAVTVHRAALPSADTSLISLAGKTDDMPGGSSGGTPGDTVMWSLNVPHGITAISRTDIVVDAKASFKLYADSGFTDEITGGTTISLTEAGATTVYVAVTAEDATTVKYYAVTVNRAGPPSTDAGLTSVAGKTDGAHGGGNGTAAGEAITWTVNVPNGKSAISRTDVVPAAGAAFKLYTDNGFTEEVTASGMIRLTAGGKTVVYVAVTAEDTVTVKYYAVSVIRDSNSYSNQGPLSSPGSEGIEVYVNGKAEKIGTLTTTKVDDRTVAALTLDQQKLSEKLAAEGPNAWVTLVMNKESDVVIAQLTNENIEKLKEYGATLEMKTAKASYKLPSRELDRAKLVAELGSDADLENVEVQIEIADSEADKVRLMEDAAQAGGFTLIVPPMDFTVKVTSQGKSYEIPRYSAYVERTIALPDGIDPSKITTGLVVETGGTTRHVPTRIEFIDGKYYAKISSLTNSTYSVIWHPLTFEDMEQHWAKNAVNDMGSRMVVQGVNDTTFLPDADITRAEYAAVIVRGLGLKLGDGANPFSDVAAGAWYESAIRTAAFYGLIEGFEDGTFRPNDKITREQAVVVIGKAMMISGLKDKLQGQDTSAMLGQFADADTVAAWAKDSVTKALVAGIITGREGKVLDPQAHVTRAEIAVMVRNLLMKSDLI